MPTEIDLHSRLGAADRAARAAGAALLAHYGARDRLAVEEKGLNDFVSNADREAEAVILDLLQPAFPEDAFLGEETGLSGAGTSGAVWCIDPLDGTANFLKGNPNWCVSIGLWLDGAAVLGVIHDPLRDETFAGIAGDGGTVNDVPLRVSRIDGFDRASLGLGHNRRVPVERFSADVAALLADGAGFRQVGAGALMLAHVAAGRVEAYVERHMWPWDAVAGLALIRAGGGSHAPYLPEGGGIAAGGPVLAGNPAMVAAIAARLDPA